MTLTPQNILSVILSEDGIRLIRRELRRATDISVSPEEIVGAVRHLLNEAAISEMSKIKISLPAKKARKKPVAPARNAEPEEPAA